MKLVIAPNLSRRRRAFFLSFFSFDVEPTLTPKILLINPSLLSLSLSLFQQNAEGGGEFYSEWEETAESFDQMGLHENLLRGIYAVSRLDGES